MRSGPDGALADVGAFMRFAQSNQALSGTLPPEMVHAISKGDAEGLQRMFRCEDHLVGFHTAVVHHAGQASVLSFNAQPCLQISTVLHVSRCCTQSAASFWGTKPGLL